MFSSALMRLRRLWSGMATRRYSTWIRGRNFHPGHGRIGCAMPVSASPWTVRAGISINLIRLTPRHWRDGPSSIIERLWRSIKYKCVYLHAFIGSRDAKAGIGRWIEFYNHQRPHKAHDGQTPGQVYSAGRPVDMMDKPRGLPTYPKAQQQQKVFTNRILAA